MSTTIPNILNDDDIAKLRKAFDNTTMLKAALAGVCGVSPRGGAWTMLSINQLYMENAAEADALQPVDGVAPTFSRVTSRADVERTVLTALLAGGHHWAFAVHVYWAMCIKQDYLRPADIADIVLITSSYGGLQVLSEGNAVLASTLTAIKRLIDAGGDISVMAVVPEITGVLMPIVPGDSFALKSAK